jgi:hypothetical protein
MIYPRSRTGTRRQRRSWCRSTSATSNSSRPYDSPGYRTQRTAPPDGARNTAVEVSEPGTWQIVQRPLSKPAARSGALSAWRLAAHRLSSVITDAGTRSPARTLA